MASPLINYVSTVITGGGGNAYLFFLLLVLAPIANAMPVPGRGFRGFEPWRDPREYA